MGESWPRSLIQTSLRSVCTGDLGQDSPIQTSSSVNKNILMNNLHWECLHMGYFLIDTGNYIFWIWKLQLNYKQTIENCTWQKKLMKYMKLMHQYVSSWMWRLSESISIFPFPWGEGCGESQWRKRDLGNEVVYRSSPSAVTVRSLPL